MNCWGGGGAAWTASSGKADGNLVTKVDLFYNGAFWHIVGDLAGSIPVVISSVIVLFFDWDFADPVLGVLIGTLILAGSSRLAIKVIRILLESTPAGLDMYQLCSTIEDSDGVTLVHDVHAWTITHWIQCPCRARCWWTPVMRGTWSR